MSRSKTPTNVAIVGASGFLGHRLAEYLMLRTDWRIRAIARSKAKLEKIHGSNSQLERVTANVLNPKSIERALKDVDVCYYFIHLMGHTERDFVEAEADAARIFTESAKRAGVKRVIYMGGLGDNAESESRHLKSRHKTGEILRSELSGVIELRASMIIGNGSVAFDIIRNIVERLPVMLLPRSAETLTQPIALHDALQYLEKAATVPINENMVVDIGGPDILTYADIYREYAAYKGLRRKLFEVPFIPTAAAGLFLDLLTPAIHARIGAIMAESMTTEMVARNDDANRLFPAIKTAHIRTAFKEAPLLQERS